MTIGRTNKVFLHSRSIVAEIYYLLADYYFKNKEQAYVLQVFIKSMKSFWLRMLKILCQGN